MYVTAACVPALYFTLMYLEKPSCCVIYHWRISELKRNFEARLDGCGPNLSYYLPRWKKKVSTSASLATGAFWYRFWHEIRTYRNEIMSAFIILASYLDNVSHLRRKNIVVMILNTYFCNYFGEWFKVISYYKKINVFCSIAGTIFQLINFSFVVSTSLGIYCNFNIPIVILN